MALFSELESEEEAIMSESEAYALVVAHLRRIGIARFHRCFSRGVETDREMRPGAENAAELPRGQRRKIWSLAYLVEEVPAGVIDSAGPGVVALEDATGMCG